MHNTFRGSTCPAALEVLVAGLQDSNAGLQGPDLAQLPAGSLGVLPVVYFLLLLFPIHVVLDESAEHPLMVRVV